MKTECAQVIAFAGEAKVVCGNAAFVPDSGGAQLCSRHNRHGCWVYFFRRGNHLKIGISTDPASRLRALMRECDPTLAPFDIEGDPAVLALVPGDAATESLFHSVFSEYRERGEWFRIEGALAELVTRLGAGKVSIATQVDLMKDDMVFADESPASPVPAVDF